VIARTNRILEEVERGIGTRVPTTRSGGKSFWDIRWPSMYLGLCRSVCFDDLVGVDAVLRQAGVGERRLSEIHRRFDSRTAGALTGFIQGVPHSADPEGFVRQRASEWRTLLTKGKVELVAHGIGEYLKTRLALAEEGARKSEAATLQARKLIDAAVRVLRGMRGGLSQRLQVLQREQTSDEDADAAAENAVRLMTFHGSKGLEFDNVWLVACEEGVIPAKGAPEEEERRLFYVGMTRAKVRLVMSHSAAGPTPFFRECGELG
jgi:hypothetical protein